MTHLSRPLLAKKADGSTRILAQASKVAQGDTLITEKQLRADQIRRRDDSTITLEPHTVLTIEAFLYDAAKAADDKAKFILTEGSVRATAGLLGRRSKDRIVPETPVAGVGMQAASLIVQYAEQSDASLASRHAYLRQHSGFVSNVLQPPVVVPTNSVSIHTAACVLLQQPKYGRKGHKRRHRRLHSAVVHHAVFWTDVYRCRAVLRSIAGSHASGHSSVPRFHWRREIAG